MEMETFIRSKPAPAIPPRTQPARAPLLRRVQERLSVAPQVFERFSQYITRHNQEQEVKKRRDLNEEIGEINYHPPGQSTCSLMLVILVISLLINILCVGIFLYQVMVNNDELIREEQCVLKKLIRDQYVKIYNNDIFANESLIDKSCDQPLIKARKYIDDKIHLLRKTELEKINQNEDIYDEDLDNLNDKIDITDLVMITQYFDKMIEGPRGCLPSTCTILENHDRDRTSILCDFNYRAKFKED